MKKIIEIILAVCFLASSGFAQEVIYFKKKSSCDSATNEVGDRTTQAGYGDIPSDQMYCMPATADCSGTLKYPYVQHRGTDAETCKIAIYTRTAASDPSGEDLVAASAAISSGGADGWATNSTTVGGSVTSGSLYWVCVIAGADSFYTYRLTSAGTTMYYKGVAGSYNNPPDPAPEGWSSTTMNYAAYVEIE
jgi:hypothetical protein